VLYSPCIIFGVAASQQLLLISKWLICLPLTHVLALLLMLPLLQSVGVAAPEDAAAGVAITNSFGMPSMARDFLMADIPAAQAALRPGQVGIPN
jgi:hypothetical protein